MDSGTLTKSNLKEALIKQGFNINDDDFFGDDYGPYEFKCPQKKYIIDKSGTIKKECNHQFINFFCKYCGILDPEHKHTNSTDIGNQVCVCGNIKYISTDSNSNNATIIDKENKTITVSSTFKSGNGYYIVTSLKGGQFWGRTYAGYDIYIPNTIKTIGERWLCDWGVTANVYYNGTSQQWDAISKKDWCKLMSARLFLKDKLICNSHEYGEFVISKEPTNTENGLKYRTCKYCGSRNEAIIEKFEQVNTRFPSVTVINKENKTITILPTYQENGITYTITELRGGQFWGRTYAGYDIYIPNTIKTIGERWLCDWGVTANVHYDGTIEQWKSISKKNWCELMSVKVYCQDGTI